MSMREQIAKAAFDKSNWIAQPGLQGTWSQKGREKWLVIADAVLAELMSPSREMLDAIGYDKRGPPEYYAMIRAAKESQ